ncbi:MAG: molybdenum cofactor synthesis domain-containing protein [Bacillota bacterium]
MGTIVAVCTSQNKGEPKKDTGRGLLLKDIGLEGDAHAGFAHRQVSLLALTSIQKMVERGLKVGPGDFAENLTVEGLELTGLPIGSRLRVGKDAILGVTQIGKKCDHPCTIFRRTGACVMPKEGIFTEVLWGGEVAKGDEIRVMNPYSFGVIIASDKASRGERVDQCGPLIREILRPWGEVGECQIVPDEAPELVRAMTSFTDEKKVDLLVTSGGTGFGPRDVTPEATLQIIERQIPGIPEAIRASGMAKTPRAMLSRGIAGIRKRSLIINLPGSPRGVRESLEVILPVLEHALEVVTGKNGDCANSC